jgi:rSAM/selenodomain-associated transferase 2
LSIIIPTWNEAETIVPLLKQLRRQSPDAEIWVADGGSVDETVKLASRHAEVIPSPRGRAKQMNHAASLANGDLLWFVHADSILPENAFDLILNVMKDCNVAGGCFRLSIPAKGMAYRLCDRWGNVGVDLFGLACGDHGIFVRREVFEKMGGYANVPLMEDVDFYRRMKRYGQVRQLRPAITTSPRRWEAHGPWKVTRTYLFLWALYLSGASMETLERAYRRVK